MSFSEAIEEPKQTIKIINDIILKEGDIVNIYGEPYCGKTSTCFYVVKQNPDKKILYVQAEQLTAHYEQKLNQLSKNVFIANG